MYIMFIYLYPHQYIWKLLRLYDIFCNSQLNNILFQLNFTFQAVFLKFQNLKMKRFGDKIASILILPLQ